MNKARGCFIFFFIIFLIAAIFIIFYLQKTPDTDTGSTLDLSMDNIYKDSSDDYLFLGIDERENQDKFQGLTDTIIIYHAGSNGIDALISIPRDTKVDLKDHGTNKINAAYEFGGPQMINDEIFELTDIGVDKVMIVNFAGFKNIIDALGGVSITITEPLYDDKSGSDFEPGTYNFTGEQALAFARNRATGKGDFDRMDRQKLLLSEIFKQKANISIIPKIPAIINILREETRSNFSSWDYMRIGFRLIKNKNNLRMLTLPGQSKTIDSISYVIVDDKEAKSYLNENLGN
ncbi:MAG: LCP family protein [Candidatus Humimicrobiaceae bacterium]